MTRTVGTRGVPDRARIDDSLGERLWTVLAIVALPVPVVWLFYVAIETVVDTTAVLQLPVNYLVYGVVNLGVVALVYWLLSPDHRATVFAFERPSLRETGAAVLTFLFGLAVFPLVSQLNAALGYQMAGMSYSLSDPTALVVVVVGAVVLAPVTEEILYRGLVLGALRSRGLGSVSAAVLMTALFALMHLPNFGVGGTIFVSVWGLLPAALRLRYENLSGAVLMHVLNNLFAYVLVVAAA